MANLQLSKNLTTLRKSYHYTQLDVSKQLNISRQAYTNYEANKRVPDIDTLIRIASIYQISLDDLIHSNIGMQDNMELLADRPPIYNPTLNISTGNTLYLTDEEVNLIMNYRDCSDSNRKIIKTFVESQKETPL